MRQECEHRGIIGYLHTFDGFCICVPTLQQEEAGGVAGALWPAKSFLKDGHSLHPEAT